MLSPFSRTPHKKENASLGLSYLLYRVRYSFQYQVALLDWNSCSSSHMTPCMFHRWYIDLTSLAFTLIGLVSSLGVGGGGVGWTRLIARLLIEHGLMAWWWGMKVADRLWVKGRGEWGREMRKRYVSLIKILFRRINPFLMCVFSEARQLKKKKNLLLCLLRQPHRPISSSLFPLSLSSWPLESLMHYVAMIIT